MTQFNALRDTIRGALNVMADNFSSNQRQSSRPSFVSYVTDEDAAAHNGNRPISPNRRTPKSSFVSYVGDSTSGPNCSSSEGSTTVPLSDTTNESDEPWEELDCEAISPNCRSSSYDALNEMVSEVDGSYTSSFRTGTLKVKRSRQFRGGTTDNLARRSLAAFPADTVGHLIQLKDGEKVMGRPVEGAIRYQLTSKRNKGDVGKLILTNMRLCFTNYHKISSEKITQSEALMPPFDIHSFFDDVNKQTDYDDDIDLINLYWFKAESTQIASLTNATFYCNDFRVIEFQLTNNSNNDAKNLLDELVRLVASPPPISNSSYLSPSLKLPNTFTDFFPAKVSLSRVFEFPLLWYKLTTDYRYVLSSDWQQLDGNLLKCPAVRLTQVNENLQLSNNLPRTFVTVHGSPITDITLESSIAPQMRGQRVPVVTYAIENSAKNGHKLSYSLLMRSATLTQDVKNLMEQACPTLREMDLQPYLPDPVAVEQAYHKLHEACNFSETTHFISSTGKWMKIVLKAINKAREIVEILADDQISVIITEESDKFWNPIVSCLVQIILNPYRRTLVGFESMLAKEFMFLTGFANKYPDGMKLPNHMYICLLLDAVHQLITENFMHFEFTSIYLIRIFDLNYLPSPFAACQAQMHGTSRSYEDLTSPTSGAGDGRRSRPMSYHVPMSKVFAKVCPEMKTEACPLSLLPSTISDLSKSQLLFLYNPFYEKPIEDGPNPLPKVPHRLMQIKFFEALFLRWHQLKQPRSYYNKFPYDQSYYFNKLVDILEAKKKISNEKIEEETILETEL